MTLLREWSPERNWGNYRPTRLASILGNLLQTVIKRTGYVNRKHLTEKQWCGFGGSMDLQINASHAYKNMKKGYGVERVHLYIAFGYWQFIIKSFIKGLVDLSWHGKKGMILLLTNNRLTGKKQTVGKMVSCHNSEKLLLASFRDLYVHNISDSLLIFLKKLFSWV